jgi:Ca-activated chloride channel family protein
VILNDAWALWVLLPAWALVALACEAGVLLERRGRLRRTASIAFPTQGLAVAAGAGWRARARRAVEALRLVTLGLLVLAMARPQTVRGVRPSPTEGIDIVLVLDTSGSMRALDLDAGKKIPERRTRLQVVKDVVAEFVKARPSDQLGLVVFGAEAFVQCPLTLDHGLLIGLLGRLESGMAGDSTAIGSGLGVAVKRLQRSQAKSKVVILLTDGINNTGPLPPRKAAEVAAALGVRVYTIGAGGRGKAPFLVDQAFFGKTVVYDDVSIDEDALKEIASLTGGAYFRAEDAAGLAAIYEQIDRLEKTELRSPALVDYDEQERWLVAPALGLLVLELLLLGSWLRRIP